MKKIRVAVIGAGQIARNAHLPAYQQMDGVEVVAVCDRRIESARKLAAAFHVPAAYDDDRRMEEESRPDLVSICVPNRFHCDLTVRALRAGAHVLCEKPPAISVREAEEMEQVARESGRLLTYGFHLRYSDQVRKLKSRIEEGGLGTVYAAEARWLRRRGIPGWGQFTNREVQGGGPLIDIGAHVLDLAAYLLGYPEADYVCADMYDRIGRSEHQGFMGEWDPVRYTVEDALFGQIHFKNGSVLRIDTSFALNMKEKNVRSVRMFGDRGGASLFPLAYYSGNTEDSLGDICEPEQDEGDLHGKEIRSVVAACRGEAPLLVTAEQGTYVQRLIGALYASAESGKPVFMHP